MQRHKHNNRNPEKGKAHKYTPTNTNSRCNNKPNSKVSRRIQ